MAVRPVRCSIHGRKLMTRCARFSFGVQTGNVDVVQSGQTVSDMLEWAKCFAMFNQMFDVAQSLSNTLKLGPTQSYNFWSCYIAKYFSFGKTFILSREGDLHCSQIQELIKLNLFSNPLLSVEKLIFIIVCEVPSFFLCISLGDSCTN